MRLRSADDSLPVDSALKEHHELLCSAFEKIGRTPYPGPDLKKWVKDAGFVNVTEEVLPVPVGRWPKDMKWVSCSLDFFLTNVIDFLFFLLFLLFLLNTTYDPSHLLVRSARGEAEER